jgi:cell division protein FtsL
MSDNTNANTTPTGTTARTGWRRFVLNQQWIVRNIPFFLFLCLLAVIYIYNGHYAEKTIKDINKNARELKELQYEYKTVKSELMFTTKQSEVAKAVAPLGLHELSHPPYRLSDSSSAK